MLSGFERIRFVGCLRYSLATCVDGSGREDYNRGSDSGRRRSELYEDLSLTFKLQLPTSDRGSRGSHGLGRSSKEWVAVSSTPETPYLDICYEMNFSLLLNTGAA